MASVLQYFNHKKAKPPQDEADKKEPDTPVLSEETEKFLEEVTGATEERPELPPRRHTIITEDGQEIKGKDAQIALMNGANEIPLPTSPAEGEDSADETEDETSSEKPGTQKAEGESKKKKHKATSYWSYVPAVPWRSAKNKDQAQAGNDLQAAVDASKTGKADKKPEQATDEDRAALTAVLDNLNLSAINNRVFSISKESQELLEKFNLILKDIINGAPTAYDDLEHLLTNYEGQLDKMFASMPPFLQTLVKSLPARIMPTLGPQLFAAASEKTSVGAAGVAQAKMKRSEKVDQTTTDKKKTKRSKMASLRSLVADQGSVVAMLRSILYYLKLRFPMFLAGTNVLMSLSVFLLLFVFWYCHKRGKETRLAKEQGTLESSTSDVEDSTTLEKPQESTTESAEFAEDPDISVPEESKDQASTGSGQEASTSTSMPAKTGTGGGGETQAQRKMPH